MSAARLQVPRCEILLASSGARGTIRSGNFSQIATVLQSGGEEGMWTFERYQRWMEQVTDWVRPPSSAALRVQGETARGAGSGRPAEGRPAPGMRAAGRPGSPPAAGTAAPRETRAAGEEIIEVPAEEMDLAALAELAKKAIERKT